MGDVGIWGEGLLEIKQQLRGCWAFFASLLESVGTQLATSSRLLFLFSLLFTGKDGEGKDGEDQQQYNRGTCPAL